MPYCLAFATGAALPSSLCLPLRGLEGGPCGVGSVGLGRHGGVLRPGAADEVPGGPAWGHHGDIMGTSWGYDGDIMGI